VLSDEEVERVLVVTAHPDDVDFGAAGTIAIWTDSGVDVTYCVVTDGDAGGFDRTFPRAEMPALRREEQRAAAKAVGVSDVRFLGYPDGRVELTLDLRRDISRVIRQVRPQRVVTQSPERNWTRIGASHPDHMTVGESTLRAVYPDARNPFAFDELLREEGLEPWSVPEIWILSSPSPNNHVDITDAFDRKITALRAHVSQTAHMDDLEVWLRERLGQLAAEAGMPAGRLAEAFAVHSTA
jgi:LmbE family N-acetylglucosaminyl deacetylase